MAYWQATRLLTHTALLSPSGTLMNADMDGHVKRAQVIAARVTVPPDQGFPTAEAWEAAPAITFSADWQGRNPDLQRQTEVRILWSPNVLFFRFLARYRQVYVYPGGNTRRDQLWLRDVAEVFIRRGAAEPRHYLEFEISPNGDWLDLEISPAGKRDLLCDLKNRVAVNAKSKVWTAELAVPTACLTCNFDPSEVWCLNLFRVEGVEPDRFYSSWQPTHTAQPNFHVPEAFGELHFSNLAGEF